MAGHLYPRFGVLSWATITLSPMERRRPVPSLKRVGGERNMTPSVPTSVTVGVDL